MAITTPTRRRDMSSSSHFTVFALFLLINAAHFVVHGEAVAGDSEQGASASCPVPGNEECSAISHHESSSSVQKSMPVGQEGQGERRNAWLEDSNGSDKAKGDENDDEDVDEEDDEDDDEDDDGDGDELKLNVFGKPQKIEIGDDDELNQDVLSVYEKSVIYMKEEVFVKPEYEFIRYRCRNYDAMCTTWAAEGSCEDEREWMIDWCSPACGTCEALEFLSISDEDLRQTEFKLESDFDATSEPNSIDLGELTPIYWGIPQNLGNMDEDKEKVREILKSMDQFMQDEVFGHDLFLTLECENKHKDCSLWASVGLCEENKEYMQLNCAPACHTCDQILFENRCPVDPEAPVAFEKPGELNAMFERIVSDPYWNENHGPLSVLSSPASTGGPWIVTLDNFLTDEECEKFIQLGHDMGFDISTDDGEVSPDGSIERKVSDHRTSTNSWCQDECFEDAVSKSLHERIEQLVRIPQTNMEYLQLLRYEPGQYYDEHHDWTGLGLDVERPPGPRVLTVFLYLNDVEAGGGTDFGRLGLTVTPKKGRVLVWPSVLDEDPLEWDKRTFHAALTVEAGVKYGANAWVHLRDFKDSHTKGCS